MIKMEERSYKRDGRAPIPRNETVSKVMRGNKAKDTKPELILRQAIWKAGLRGYRLHWKKVPGRPDIAFPGRKLAVFVNGCYWHRCPNCRPHAPRTNQAFWNTKFQNNIARDEKKIKELNAAGWRTMVLWECEIKTSLEACVRKISEYYKTI